MTIVSRVSRDIGVSNPSLYFSPILKGTRQMSFSVKSHDTSANKEEGRRKKEEGRRDNLHSDKGRGFGSIMRA